ncbi:hypothetical protein QFC20_005949 [Naganishia adeliensis]|uniref:Uncharacterized protein n=2 Tax=Naganishia adeliensis TaxID=92952 RepID=A0ACC2UZI2_9TREE|nr:hypothetical protein QFC20_007349 [Naganishia adeliensis]KAJ9098522.1 hypothetical protein QFC20_005949 [Naganishia adeliensis]
MLASAITTSILACLIGVGRASPIARNDDGPSPKPISCTAPDGERLCWQPNGEHPSAGQILVVSTCQADSPIQQFILNPGPTHIQLLNTSLCVEFGPGLGRNGTPLRLQNCRGRGAPGQRLFITDDNHIALQNGPGQCADVRDGKVVDDVGELQSWRCAADNTNQIFSFDDVPPEPEPEDVPPLGAIQLYSNDSLCLTVAEPGFESGLLGLTRQQDILAQGTTIGGVFGPFYRFQNWASGSFMAAVEDAQAETGYTVETVDNPFEFDISEFFIYAAEPAEPNPNPNTPAEEEGGDDEGGGEGGGGEGEGGEDQPRPEGSLAWLLNSTLCLQAESGFDNGTGTLGLGICGSVPIDQQRFYIKLVLDPPYGADELRLIDDRTGDVYCIDFGETTYDIPPPTGTPIFYAPCDPSRPSTQNVFVQGVAVPGIPDTASAYRFQNLASGLWIIVNADASAESGYAVQTGYYVPGGQDKREIFLCNGQVTRIPS